MKKTWKLGNGFNRVNDYGQSVLCEIGPREFDPEGSIAETGDEYGAGQAYYFDNTSCAYVFRRKRDWLEAIENLREKGYAS